MQKLLKIYQHQLELIEYEIEKQKVDAKIGIVLDKATELIFQMKKREYEYFILNIYREIQEDKKRKKEMLEKVIKAFANYSERADIYNAIKAALEID